MLLRQERALVLLLATALSLLSASAFAQDAVERFSRLLLGSEDFRVRTQAALALGAAKHANAVSPLCRGLNDGSAAVRVAAATALRRLNLGGTACLTQRLSVEENQLAKSAISRAIEALGGTGSEAPPVITQETRYYVSLGAIKDVPGREGGATDRLVVAAMRRGAGQSFAFAPRRETPKEAQTFLAKHAMLKAFYLAPKVSAVYAGGSLTVKIEVAMFNYPGKALLGSFSVRAAQPGVLEDDVKSRDDLIRTVAEGAIQKFAKAAAQL